MNLTALDSLASGSLGAVVIAVVWIVRHDSQIKGLLNLLPAVAQDAAKARTAVETSGVGPAIQHVKAELDDEAKDLLRGLVAKLEAQVAPMTEPVVDTVDSPAVVEPAAVPDPAPQIETAAVATISGVADGTYVLRDGQLRPAGS